MKREGTEGEGFKDGACGGRGVKGRAFGGKVKREGTEGEGFKDGACGGRGWRWKPQELVSCLIDSSRMDRKFWSMND